MNSPTAVLARLLLLATTLGLAACPWGRSEPSNDPETPPAVQTASIGVNVENLQGAGTVEVNLRLEVGGAFADAAAMAVGNGEHTFAVDAPDGATYSVYTSDHPDEPLQRCDPDPALATGTVAGEPVVVAVDCVSAYKVGGTLTGLEDGKWLEVAHTVDGFGVSEPLGTKSGLTLRANGEFEFAYPHRSGEAYEVYILTGFTSANYTTQRCDISNGGTADPNGRVAGVIADANVTDIVIDCGEAFPLPFSVSGLEGGAVVLQNTITNDNAADPDKYPIVDTRQVNVDGDGEFFKQVKTGESYLVTIAAQPTNPEQICKVQNGSGTVADVAPLKVSVSCGDATIGGTVRGMIGTGLEVILKLEVENNGNVQMLMVDDLAIDENGEFEFGILVSDGDRYEVAVRTQPSDPDQECTVENAEGVVFGSVTDVEVKCPGPRVYYEFSDNYEVLESGTKESLAPESLYREFKFDRGPEMLGRSVGLDATPLFTQIIDRPRGDGAIYSSESGKTYWTIAESPPGQLDVGQGGLKPFRHFAVIRTSWLLRKQSAASRFQLVVSKAEMLGYADVFHPGGMSAGTFSRIDAYRVTSHEPGPVPTTVIESTPYFSTGGQIRLRASAEDADDLDRPPNWHSELKVPEDVLDVMWSTDDFDENFAAGVGGMPPELAAILRLNRNIEIEIDLSDIEIGQDVLVIAEAEAYTHNIYSMEGGTAAYFRDPAQSDPGAGDEGVYVGAIEDMALLEIGTINPSGTSVTPNCEADDAEPSILEFDADSYEISEVAEQNITAPIRVLRTNNGAGYAGAQIALIGDTATADEDFDSEDRLVRFGHGSFEPRTLSHFVIDDQRDEGAETLTLVLHSPEGCAEIGTRYMATVTILPSDPSPGAVAFTGDTFEVDESDGFAAVTIERVGGTAGSRNVTVVTADGTGTAGVDYGTTSTQVVFQHGDAAARTVQVPILDNVATDGDRTVLLSITATDATAIGEPSEAVLTIRDNDLPERGRLQLGAPRYAVGEGDGRVVVTVTREGGSTGIVSVDVETSDFDAVAPDDYGAVSTVVTFADGDDAPKDVAITIADDPDEEGDEAFNVLLSNPAGGASIGTPGVAPVVIVDNDGVPPPAPGAPTLGISGGAKELVFDWATANGATFYRLLMDTAGTGSFAQVGADLPLGETMFFLPVSVHLFDWMSARFLLQACNSSACTDSNVVSAQSVMLAAIGFFKSSNSDIADYFGWAVAISADGRTLAASAPREDSAARFVNADQADNSVRESGAVYVFAEEGAGWFQQAYIKAPNTDAFDAFGQSLALSADGSTLAVGAPVEGSNATGINGDTANNSAGAAGAAYVYARNSDVWALQAYVKASNTDAGDFFGTAVALADDGNTLVVGAPEESSAAIGIGGDESDNGAAESGAAYVFTRSGSDWTQSAYVKASNAEPGDWFGSAIAISGDGLTMAVAAQREDSAATDINGDQSDNSAPGSGHTLLGTGAVYVFSSDGSAWTQQAYVKPSNLDADDRFGSALALSGDGNVLAVGAMQEDSIANGVGSTLEADNSADGAGAAYVFERRGGLWQQRAYVKASNTRQGNQFGSSVDVSADGRQVVVGAVLETSMGVGVNGDDAQAPGVPVGAVYLFAIDDATGDWTTAAYIKASNSDQTASTFGGRNINFGHSVSLSTNGGVLAIGAYVEPSDARGIGGDQVNENANLSGAVYLY